MNEQMFQAVADPKAATEVWLPVILAALHKFEIEDPEEQCAWLANAAHESTGFTSFTEGLNYRWDALLNQWAKRFDPRLAVAVGRVDKVENQGGQEGVRWKNVFYPTGKHGANQPAIANAAYGNRNGNTLADDGWRFRGRGIFQLTFRGNYQGYADYVEAPEIMTNPDLVAAPEHAAKSAAWFWVVNRKLGDMFRSRGFEAVCVAINGGRNGLEERTKNFETLRSIINQ